ncbi:restriction endonuclease subunit S [Pseudomonas chlororaphis]|uniref:Restriction endonuclease subunit S n=1 Tax=Pseudomonas sp. W17 TaxID=3144407 RepID=A0AAU7WNS1_9PSED
MTSANFTRLGDFAKEVSRRAASEANLPVYSVTKHQGFVPSLEYFRKQVFSRDTKGYKMVAAGELAYATIHLDEGSIGVCPEASLISPMYTVFSVDETKANANYLERFLKSPQALSAYPAFAKGSVHRRAAISFGRLAELPVPLPALPEQRRIVAILDKADALRAKRREAITKLDQLLQSVFLEMFGDPVTNPKGWRMATCEDLCRTRDDIKCGPFGTQLAQAEYQASEGVPLWGIKHVNVNFQVATHEYLSEEKASKLSQYSIESGDLVMTRKGTVGKCAIYPDDAPPGVMHSDLLRFRVDRKICNPIFLRDQFRISPLVKSQLEVMSSGAIMPGINVSKLKKLSVFVPDIEFQETYAKVVTRSINDLSTSWAKSIEATDRLFFSLQHRAFSGKL